MFLDDGEHSAKTGDFFSVGEEESHRLYGRVVSGFIT